MFLGYDDLPFRFVALAPTTAIELALPSWPPSSDLGLTPDNNLLFLRLCALEYWDYLQDFKRKAEMISMSPFHQNCESFAEASVCMPSSCRIGLALLLDIAQQSAESIRILVAAVHVHVSSMIFRLLSSPTCCCCDVSMLTRLQSSAPNAQASGVCALFPSFLLFVGRFAGSIIWTKVPFSRDIVAWQQDHVILLQNSRTTNWFVAACESSEATKLLAEIKQCLDHIWTSASQAAVSATYDSYSASTPSYGLAAKSSMQLGRSLDSTYLTRSVTQQHGQGIAAGVALTETLLFGEHRCSPLHADVLDSDNALFLTEARILAALMLCFTHQSKFPFPIASQHNWFAASSHSCQCQKLHGGTSVAGLPRCSIQRMPLFNCQWLCGAGWLSWSIVTICFFANIL
jgi:hypothetical protein